jgi:hypothetical protein
MASLLPIVRRTKEWMIMKTITAIAFGCMVLAGSTLHAQIAGASINTGKKAPITQTKIEATHQPVKIQAPAVVKQSNTFNQPAARTRLTTAPGRKHVKVGKGQSHENNGNHYGHLKDHNGKGQGYKHANSKKGLKKTYSHVNQKAKTHNDRLEGKRSGTRKTKGGNTSSGRK